MKPASIREIKEELQVLQASALSEIIMRLGRFKKENKELLTYLLMYKQKEERYIADIKESLHIMFTEVNVKTLYITKKNLRKILRITNRYIKYTSETTTEIELLIFFVEELHGLDINFTRNTTLQKLRLSLISRLEKGIMSLHEDLQYDYNKQLQLLKDRM